jgi:CheY-like chemotaxis protein
VSRGEQEPATVVHVTMQRPSDDPPPRVLVIEHDPGVRMLLGRLLDRWGLVPLLASTPRDGARALRDAGPVDLVLSDFRPDVGEATMHDRLAGDPDPPAFVCTLPRPTPLPEGVTAVSRPFSVADLREVVVRALGR